MKRNFLLVIVFIMCRIFISAQTEPSILSNTDTKAWYVAESQYITLTDGNYVDQWDDKSGNGYYLWQPSSPLTYRPLFYTDSVVFDNDLDQLENLVFNYAQPLTVYLVANFHGFAGGYAEIVDFDDINIHEYLDGDSIIWEVRSPIGGGYLRCSDVNKIPKNEYIVLTATFNGTNSSLRINDNERDIGGTMNGSIEAVRLLLSHNALDASVRELVVRNVDDTDSDENTIVNWFMAKYDIGTPQEYGGNIYVATDGSDNNTGTINEPFATWQKAIDVALPGDTVYFRGGVYFTTEPVRIDPEYYLGALGTNGTYENPITYMSYPGEWAILDCRYHCDSSSIQYNSGISINYAEHLYFKDFEIRNVYQCSDGVNGAISIGYSRNMTFEHVILHDIGQRGFYINGGAWLSYYEDINDPDSIPAPFWNTYEDTTRFINCDVYNLCDSFSLTPGNAADAWKTIHYRGNYISWEGCRAWNYTDDAIDPSLVNGGKWKIDRCWALPGGDYKYFDTIKMEQGGFKLSSSPLYDPPDSVHFGTISRCLSAYASSGFGTAEKDKYRGNFLFYNNTAYHCIVGYYGTGTGTVENPRTAEYYNNIEYESTDISAIGGPYGIALLSDPGLLYPESHNTWDVVDGYPDFQITDSVTVTDGDFVNIDSLEIISQLTAPRKSDGSLPDITVFQLAEGSDLIDAGTYVGLPYNGSAPDIGAFEFGTYTPPMNDSILITSTAMLIDSITTNRQPGDILWLKGNSFTGDIDFSLNGNANFRSEIRNHKDFNPTFSGVVTISGEYINFKGLQFNGGININGDVVTIDSCNINSTLSLNLCYGSEIINNNFSGSGSILIFNFPSKDPRGEGWHIDNNTYNIGLSSTFNGHNYWWYTAKYDKFDKNSNITITP